MPVAKGLALDDLRKLRDQVFAPMVQQLEIEPIAITDIGAEFEIPASEFIIRTGGVVCGQALASIADTVGVLALFAHNEEQRIMTTADMNTHFIRPLYEGVLKAEAYILSNGRRMATVRIDITQNESPKIASSTTCGYVYI